MMDLKTSQFIDHIIARCCEEFPRPCSTCGRVFESFSDFILKTTPIGEPVSYDTMEDLIKDGGHPVGSLSYVNCSCGTTLSIQCGDASSEQYLALVASIDGDARHNGLSVDAVLEILRQEIRTRVSQD